MTTLRRRLGRAVRRLRKQAGYSQESFADRCKVHRTYMGAVETMPPFRDLGFDSLSKDQWHASKVLSTCSWIQGLEGNIGSSHTAFLHLNYGQRTAEKELSCFRAIAEHYGVGRTLEVDVSHLSAIGGSSLTDRRIAVEKADLSRNSCSASNP